jgi:hypothetical protein
MVACEDDVPAIHGDRGPDLLVEDVLDAMHDLPLRFLMASTRGWARSAHSNSSRFVTVTKFEAMKTPTTPSTAKSRAARGESAEPTASGKLVLWPGSASGSARTHLTLFGFGVRSACIRKPRSML